jgi:predicted phosphate transport protein (TIGR00153 family)
MGSYISKIFGASPVGPIQDHMETCYQCTRELVTFFEHVVSEDWDQVEVSRQKIVNLEHEADDIKKQIRTQLSKSLLMPVPRRDLLELLLVQDQIANRTRDISELVLGRRLMIPETIQADFLAFVSRSVDAAKQARKSVNELDELYETGFRGAEAELVESLVHEMDQIEDEVAAMQATIRGAIFAMEDDLPPVNVIFLYRVIKLTGDIADVAEGIGQRLEFLMSH